MTNPVHLVAVGGILGAVARHLVSEAVDSESFPFGTLTVNVVGSFVLASVTFLNLDDELLLLVGTGACGSFTTFSSFSFNAVRLWETDESLKSVVYALANLVGALLAIGVAWYLTRMP